MNSSGVGSFTKQAACPSSKTMLSYCSAKLSPKIKKLVTWHLSECDFCAAEVQLLAHHAPPRKGECRPPAGRTLSRSIRAAIGGSAANRLPTPLNSVTRTLVLDCAHVSLRPVHYRSASRGLRYGHQPRRRSRRAAISNEPASIAAVDR